MTAPGTDVTVKDGETTVTAPYTTVKSNADRTNITVDAPHTSIKVDTDSRTVRIRVPYFSGDIRW
jgi:phage baseplate assembly protein gpV